MTQPGPPRRRDLLRPLDLLGVAWSSAAGIPPVSTGAAAAYRTLFMTVRRLVIGRRVTIRLDGGDLTMTVTKFDSRLDMRRLAAGQIDDMRINADRITWGTGKFGQLRALLRNVHIQPGTPAMLVAAPVQLAVDIPADTFEGLLAGQSPSGRPRRFGGQLDADGTARVRWTRRPNWGNLEVDAELDGPTLRLRPRALTVGSPRWELPARIPARRVRLPELPYGLQLTDVRITLGLLRLRGTLPRWQMEISRRRAEVLLYQLSTAGLLSLTRSSLRSATGRRRANRPGRAGISARNVVEDLRIRAESTCFTLVERGDLRDVPVIEAEVEDLEVLLHPLWRHRLREHHIAALNMPT